jgi:DNA-binding phage protein
LLNRIEGNGVQSLRWRKQRFGITAIAKEVGLSRQAVYRIKDDPVGAEAALAAWGL